MNPEEDPEEASDTDLGEWLEGLGLGRFRALFAEQEIDEEALRDLTDAELERWGIPFGPRRRLLRAIAARTDALPRDRAAMSPRPDPVPAPPRQAPAHPQGPSAAERRQVTALFCDMVGSSALAARLDPEDMSAIIAAYHDICRTAIERLGGRGLTYFGDGVFGCFGWPEAHEDDAERAVRAGLAILRAVRSTEFRHGVAVQVRIGIATGLVVIGALEDGAGGDGGARRDVSIVGETPNLAARLQQMTEPDTLVVSAGTRGLLGTLFDVRLRGTVALKGFEEPVEWWEVAGEAVVESRFAAARGSAAGLLLGRETELALLHQRWQLARAGEGQVVLLSGEPGIGKSHLAEALSASIRQEDSGVLFRYQCSPFHRDTPLHPVISQIERVVSILPGDDRPTRLAKLRTLATTGRVRPEHLPMVTELVVAPGEDPAAGSRDAVARSAPGMKEILARLREFLLDAARERPLIVLVEDAHWIDPSTRDLLDELAGSIRHQAILLLVTIRSGAEAVWSAPADATRLQLNRLDRRSAAQILDRLEGAAKLSQAVRDLILEKTDGVPLFVEELAKAALAAGRALDQVAGVEVPTTLHDSLMAQLDRLPEAKHVAQTCAVIGRESSDQLLRAVLGMPATGLDRALQALVDAEIMVRRGVGTDAVFRFRHALLQDAAYASLLRTRRRQLHARIGETLRADFPATAALSPEVLARHFTEALRTEEAVVWWQRAGQAASRRSADAEATVHLRKALEMLGALPDGDARDRLEIALRSDLMGPIFGVQGFTSAEAEANAERGRTLCERHDAPDKAFLFVWAHSQMAITRCDLDRALQSAERLSRTAEELADDRLRAVARRNLGITLSARGEQRGARLALRDAVALCEARHGESGAFAYGLDPLCTARGALALALQQLGEVDEARAAIDLAEREARSGQHVLSLTYVLYRAGLHDIIACDVDGVGRRAAELVELGRTRRYDSWSRLAETLAGWHRARCGAMEEGLGRMRAGIEGQRSRGSHFWMPLMMIHEAELLAEAGEPAAALARLDEAEADMRRLSHGFAMADLHRQRGVILAAGGATPDVVEACFAAGRAIAEAQGAVLGLQRLARDAARIAGAGRHGATCLAD